MSEHTLLPWAVSEHCGMPSRGWIKSVCKGFPEKMVAQVLGQETTAEREANTAYIVKACNSFPDLVKALEEARSYIEYSLDRHGNDIAGNGLAALNAADRVLALVGGEKL